MFLKEVRTGYIKLTHKPILDKLHLLLYEKYNLQITVKHEMVDFKKYILQGPITTYRGYTTRGPYKQLNCLKKFIYFFNYINIYQHIHLFINSQA